MCRAVQWATVYINELCWLSYLSHIDEQLLPYKELRVCLPQSPACPENKHNQSSMATGHTHLADDGYFFHGL